MGKQGTAQLDRDLGIVVPPRGRLSLVEDWLKAPKLNADILNATEATRMIANEAFEVLGTNATSASCVHSTGGGLKLTTAGADADQVILLPHLDANQSLWSISDWATDDEVAFGARLATDTSIADIVIWCGLKLTNTSVIATDDDQAFFRYASGENLKAVYSIGGTDYEIDTGVALAASTEYDLKIAIDDDRYVTFYVNGEKVHETRSTELALTTGVDLIPYTGVQASAAAAKSLHVRPRYAIAKTTNN